MVYKNRRLYVRVRRVKTCRRPAWLPPKVEVRHATLGVQQLVLEAFVGHRPYGLDCCHYNGDCQDNRPANLRWDTRRGNMQDNVRLGVYNKPQKPPAVLARGENHANAKITNAIALQIVQLFADGSSVGEISARLGLGLSRDCVYAVVTGRTWRHVTGVPITNLRSADAADRPVSRVTLKRRAAARLKKDKLRYLEECLRQAQERNRPVC